MPHYNSGYFLEIFLENRENKKEIIERLRELEREHPEIEVWPKLGVSNMIRVSSEDSLLLTDWEKIKAKVKAIIEESQRRSDGK